MTPLLWLLLLLAALLLLAFFRAVEIAHASLRPAQLHRRAETGDAGAARLLEFLLHNEKLLGMAVIGSNLCWILAIACCCELEMLGGPVTGSLPGQLLLNMLLVAPFGVLLAVVLPEALARAQPDKTALRLETWLWRARWLFWPLVWLATRLSLFVANCLGCRLQTPQPRLQGNLYLSRDDLVTVAELVVEQGIVSAATGRMVEALFEIHSRPVSSCMIPLIDLRSLPETATVGDAESLAARCGFSRLPVYRDRPDNIVGLVDLRQILYAALPPETPLATFVLREILFVPGDRSIGSLLNELRARTPPLAFIVDEYGGIEGMATLSDLVEEVVGDFQDERLGSSFFEIAPGRFECAGRLDIHQFGQRLGGRHEFKGVSTVGGLVMKRLGRIPKPGDSIEVEGHRVTVLDMENRRVTWVGVGKVKKAASPAKGKTS